MYLLSMVRQLRGSHWRSFNGFTFIRIINRRCASIVFIGGGSKIAFSCLHTGLRTEKLVTLLLQSSNHLPHRLEFGLG